MDQEISALLAQSIESWCGDNKALIEQMERYPLQHEFPAGIFETLNQLGILHLLADSDTHHEMQMLAEIAYQLAKHSPSLAVMVVQQNLAAWLYAESATEIPSGWLALPLFDAVVEWPCQLTRSNVGSRTYLQGRWQGIPVLPLASHALLPVVEKNADHFLLVAVPLGKNAFSGARTTAPVFSLGLRGCPLADLLLDNVAVAKKSILLSGEQAYSAMQVLWSQAEICMMAVRAGIAESSYAAARDYASQRYQGGKVIIKHSLIRKMLAEFYREKAGLDELWRAFSRTLTPGIRISQGQMGLALNSGERLPWLTSDGIQILGGVGYMEDYYQERRFRDAKQCEFLLGHPQARNFSLWQSEAE